MPTLDWQLRLVGNRYVRAPEVPAEPTTLEGTSAPELTIEQQLRAWTISQAWTWNSVTPHSTVTDIVAAATITWPDLSTGTYTLLTPNAALHQWDSFKVTHAKSGKTVTHSVKGRNGAGLVTGYTTTIS